MPLDINTMLADRYRLEREIGAGGMATVHAARDTRHDRSVAVKVLRPELASAIGGERFLREIAIVARLQHPHIVGLIDSDLCTRLVQALRMRNLDSGVLGSRYREDTLRIEPGIGHFDLLEPDCVRKHVSDVLTIAASGTETGARAAPDRN